MRSKFGGENQENQTSEAVAQSTNGHARVAQAASPKVGPNGEVPLAKGVPGQGVPQQAAPRVAAPSDDEVDDRQERSEEEAEVAVEVVADGQVLADASIGASLAAGLSTTVSGEMVARQGSPVESALGFANDDDGVALPLLLGGLVLVGGGAALLLGGGGNTVPVITSGSTATVAENAPSSTVVYDANATDADKKDILTYSLSGADAGSLSINSTTGAVTLNASPNFEAKSSYAFTVNVSDGEDTVSQSVTLTVTNVNETPVITSGATGTVAENAATSTVVYDANGTDVDANTTLAYSLGGADAAAFNINSATGEVTLKASANFEAKSTYAITVTATDNGAPVLSATQAVTISVTNVNEAPVANDDTYTATEGTGNVTATLASNDSDPDAGDVLTYSVVGAAPAGLTLNADGSWVFDTNNAAYNSLGQGATATATFTYLVTDLGGLTDTANVSLTVTGTNDAPVANDDTYVATEGTGNVTGDLSDNDSDVDVGDVLTYSVVGAAPAGLTLNADGSWVFDTNNAAYDSLAVGESATATFTYQVSDGNGGTDTANVSLTVNGTNDAPIIVSGTTGTVAENAATSTVVYDANATDVDASDTLTYSLAAGGDAAAFNINGATGEVRLNASANFENKTSYSFTVVVSDGLATDTQVVTIGVTDEIDQISVDGLGNTQAPVTVSAGVQPGDLTDTNWQINESSGVQTEVDITNFGANDFIFFQGLDPNDYTFQNDGNGNLVITRLDDDGFTTNVITLVGTTGGLIDPGALVFNEATAEDALAAAIGVAGDYLRGSADPLQTTIDGNSTFNAAGAQVTFTEDLDAPESFIVINNFRSDDVIVFIDGDIGEVSFGTDPGDAKDLRIDYFDFNTNQASTIIMNDVLDPFGPAIFDQASAEAALATQLGAGDYFQVG